MHVQNHDCRVAGLLLGADDYVTKPFDPEELLARVRRVVERSSSAESDSAAERKRLTPREREILSLFALGEGTKTIAERLHISPKTVSTHIQRMLVKLDLHSRGEAVAFAYREGLVKGASGRAASALAHSGRNPAVATLTPLRAHSSAGERPLHTREVPGSIPGAPIAATRLAVQVTGCSPRRHAAGVPHQERPGSLQAGQPPVRARQGTGGGSGA